MHRYILTGAPGAGKTALIRALETVGVGVVEEAATDVIALSQARGVDEPWTRPDFIALITDLQERRIARAAALPEAVQAHDRGPPCVLALAEFLDLPVPPALESALAQAVAGQFERRVLLVRLGETMVNTAARRITLEDARRFEAVHAAVYRRLGFELVDIAPGPIGERLRTARAAMGLA